MTALIDLSQGERELLASEQMRDRIADFLHAEAIKRAGNSGRKDALLLGMERAVRCMPGRIVQIDAAAGLRDGRQ